ncbi:hypothetical protein BC834DRAFT_900791, partial [Gloeopeniophorella convolvens]
MWVSTPPDVFPGGFAPSNLSGPTASIPPSINAPHPYQQASAQSQSGSSQPLDTSDPQPWIGYKGPPSAPVRGQTHHYVSKPPQSRCKARGCKESPARGFSYCAAHSNM